MQTKQQTSSPSFAADDAFRALLDQAAQAYKCPRCGAIGTLEIGSVWWKRGRVECLMDATRFGCGWIGEIYQIQVPLTC